MPTIECTCGTKNQIHVRGCALWFDTSTTHVSFETPPMMTFRAPNRYDFIPKEDITAYELALCLPIFTDNNWYDYGLEDFINALPENARRHFEEIKP